MHGGREGEVRKKATDGGGRKPASGGLLAAPSLLLLRGLSAALPEALLCALCCAWMLSATAPRGQVVFGLR